MKASRYNLFLDHDNHWIVYNQAAQSILEVDEELKRLLEENKMESIPHEVMEELQANGFVCPDDQNEPNVILARSKMNRFNSRRARVTVMPTLNCNFRCWYCYEHHHKSSMSEEGARRTIAFCKKLIESKTISTFQLDWFGGEPLLYFDETVYPISKAVQEACREAEVRFFNTITTNGYLIDKDRIEKMNEIELRSFQITLDGDESFHDRTRYSKEDKHTYSTITRNITDLCRNVEYIDMTARINYTPDNVVSLENIADTFPKDVRKDIQVTPQVVWQFKVGINETTEQLKEKLEYFVKAGYPKAVPCLGGSQCYTENMKQFVVNYDLKVYKCTARDFKPENAIGDIDENGDFVPLPHYYDYYTASGLESEKCLTCNVLPSCMGTCIQKKVEGYMPECNPEQIKNSTLNNLRLYLEYRKE